MIVQNLKTELFKEIYNEWFGGGRRNLNNLFKYISTNIKEKFSNCLCFLYKFLCHKGEHGVRVLFSIVCWGVGEEPRDAESTVRLQVNLICIFYFSD